MLGTLGAALLATMFQATPCESLTSFSIENGTIATADLVSDGPFVRPGGGRGGRGGGRGGQTPEPIPAHCRVTMVLTPTSDSNINVELWMPAQNWNGRFLAVGNGGFAGSIQGYGDMQTALRRGYATAATDSGHSSADGPSGMFGLGHPEKIVDFSHRAVHDMTVKSKRILDHYYDQPLNYAYFKGCSTGGRQAMMAAQRYPGDFDGIIAGALANRHIYMHTAGVARNIQIARNPDQAISEELAEFVSDSVMNQCDTLDEGFLNNPRQCTFNFASLLCSGGNASGSALRGQCLSEPQLRTVETWYGGLKNSKGEMIFSGQALGNPMRATRGMNENSSVSDTVRIWGFQDENYDWRTFDLDRDMPIIDAATGFVDSDDPDLRGFEGHGGKLLLYAGWGDTTITPENTVHYYETVLEEMGPVQDDWMRLFLVPSMGHCGGGPGPNTFDSIATMESWREEGLAPAQILGSNPQTGLTRPLCPYPQYARYDGSGNLADASNWSCSAP
jgi:feruloyl esterase